jgi:hypothetical protein
MWRSECLYLRVWVALDGQLVDELSFDMTKGRLMEVPICHIGARDQVTRYCYQPGLP